MRYILLLILTLLTPLSANAEQRKTTIKNIPYIAGSTDKKQQLDIYLPEQETKNAPVHIFIHGGGWTIGDKKHLKTKQARAYTNQNIIVVSPNYRLSPNVKHPAHVQDVAAAINWTHKNIAKYGGDPKNMVLSGHSAGAHLVALVGTDSHYLAKHGLKLNIFKAIIPVDSGNYDVSRKQVGPFSGIVQRWKDNTFGTNPEELKAASPIYQDLSQNLSPFLITVTAKRQDALSQSKRLVDALKSNKKTAEILIIDDLTHGEMQKTLFESGSETFNRVIKYLQTANIK